MYNAEMERQEARRQVSDTVNQVEWILGSLRSMQ